MSASDEQWLEIRRRWEAGDSNARCCAGFEVSHSTVGRRAKDQCWVRDDETIVRKTVEQTERIKAKAGERWAARRADLLDELVDDLFRIKAQLFAPSTRREVKVVGQGEGRQDVEIIDVHTPLPPVADQKAIAVTFAVLMDKTLLLAGEATSRAETGPIADRETATAMVQKVRDELAERRAAQELVADETRVV
jgi:hypothetical protein